MLDLNAASSAAATAGPREARTICRALLKKATSLPGTSDFKMVRTEIRARRSDIAEELARGSAAVTKSCGAEGLHRRNRLFLADVQLEQLLCGVVPADHPDGRSW